MTTVALARYRASLNMQLLDDAERQTLLSGIQKVAPTSPMIQVASVASSYSALTTKGSALVAAITVAAANLKLYKASVTTLAASRLVFDRELDTLKTLVDNNATSGTDVTSMGFVLQNLTKPQKTTPDAPTALVVLLGKVHGKARVAVQGKGYLGSFAAEVSTDPIGAATWEVLPGHGKQRRLAAPTGTKLWVHFAAIRFGLQSAWSTPVLITMP